MGKRFNVGLLFSYDENWIGGTYYIINLIYSLNNLDDELKPRLVILAEKEIDFKFIKEINYPYIEYILLTTDLNFIYKIINKITRNIFFKKNVIKSFEAKIDVIFPSNGSLDLGWIKRQLFWIPDFQELRLPNFFPEYNLVKRKNNRLKFSLSKENVIFSSQDSLDDYNFFFPMNKTINHVLNFKVFHSDFSNLGVEILQKYSLNNKKYFFSPNQFWKHKNHIIILKALVELKKHNSLNFIVVFTGKEYDSRNPNYFEDLKKFVKANNIEDNVAFLGFIDRNEQLFLMQNSMSIIQPSLFEGWSSVVEDAKRLKQICIVSDLKVHREQLGNDGYYFNPMDEIELAGLLLKISSEEFVHIDLNYEEQFNSFGLQFMQIIEKVINFNKV
jgi:glycosyltransferase involved in cell wall biosynthesis